MLFRQAGIFHTDYAADRALFPIPADRWMIARLLALAILAPLLSTRSISAVTCCPGWCGPPATLGLNLILGWAGQFHLGYAAVMGIGAYTTVHADKRRHAVGDRRRARRADGDGHRHRASRSPRCASRACIWR